MFKKTLLTAVLVFSFVFAPVVFADTASDLQSQINAILAQIKVLQAAINAQSGNTSTTIDTAAGSGGSTAWCHNWNTNLRVGSSNSDVSALQYILQQEGFLSTSGDDKGTFGESTASAVTGFQEKYRGEILTPNGLKYGTGFVGASTRAKLNSLYGCNSSTPQPSITIITPNGGETYAKGSQITVGWLENYNANPLVIRLFNFDTGVEYYSGKTSGSVGKNAQTLPPEAANVPDGQYRITICDENTPNPAVTFKPLCDSSDSYFKIYSGSTTNNPPKIVGVPAIPTNVQPGQTVNISLSATDPDNDDLSWGVDWGENGGSASSCSVVRRQTGTGWNFNSSHSWAQAGTYKVKVTVSDCVGGSDSYSFSVTVGNSASTNQPPVISGITAPTTLNVNQTGTWTVNASDPENGPLSYAVNWGDAITNSAGASAVPAANFVQTATFSHTYATAGTYTVNFTVRDGAGLTAQTSSTVQVGNTAQFSITVLSPSRNANWVSGISQTVSWRSKDGSGNVGVFMTRASDGLGCLLGQASLNSASITVTPTIGQSCSNQNMTLTAGNYYLSLAYPYVNATNNAGGLYGDSSGQTIPIILTSSTSANQPSITVLSPNGGESWQVGQTYDIRWSSTGIPSNSQVNVGVVDYDCNCGDLGSQTIAQISNSGTYSWAVPQSLGTLSFNLGHRYKVWIDSYYNRTVNTGAWEGNSVNTFTITSPTAATQKTLNAQIDPSVIGTSAVAGSTNVPILSMKLSASGGDVSINGLQVSAYPGMVEGVSAKVVHLKIYDGDTMVAAAGLPTLGSDGTTVDYPFTFSATIPNGVSKLYTVKADILATASGAIKFGLTSINHSYGSALTIPASSFSWGNNINIVAPTSAVTTPTVSAGLVDASNDKAGAWGVFGPGSYSNNPYDWHVSISVNGGGRALQSMTLSHNNGETWSTSNSNNWPLVVYQKSAQVNSGYAGSLSLQVPADTVLDLYAQMGVKSWSGGALKIVFADGSSATAQIPASAVTAPTTTTTTTTSYSGNNMTANMMDALRLMNPGLYR